MFIYTIEQGDTLFRLAEEFGTTIESIAITNNIRVDDTLVIGQALVIPVDKFNYVVQRGDTIYNLARRFGISMQDIINANPDIVDYNRISIGQTLIIPFNQVGPSDVVVNGYMLPGIDEETLQRTLQYLNYLSIFSYEAMPNGELKPIMDEEYIEIAKMEDVKPLMTITNIGEDGFSSEIAHTLLTDSSVQNIFISNILNLLNSKGYYGLNVDFEYLYPEDKDLYTNFLRNIRDRLKQNGYILAVAVAPKISEDQKGVLYEAHDYKSIGKIADIVIIMTYEWGYLYGDPQAISPINKIEEVISYAVTEIPTNKILLGVSNYAYDWTLPWIRGTQAAYLSNQEALNLARQKGSNIQFDEVAQSPFFTYYTPTNQHVVWYEDSRSLFAKLQLVDKYNLLGISYWNINYYINPSGLLTIKN